MQKKTLAIALAIVVIAHLQQPCSSIAIMATAKSAISFGTSLISIIRSLIGTEDTLDQTLLLVQQMNRDIQFDMSQILQTLQDLPAIIALAQQQATLESYFSNIGRVFSEAIRIKRRVDDGQIENNNNFYEQFRANNEGEITRNIHEIQRILTDQATVFFFQTSFNHAIEKYETVCETGMSHLQLLDTLLGNLKVATIQYYISRNLMYSFLELIGDGNYTNVKRNLLEDVHRDYSIGVNRYRTLMSTASRDLWTCDPAGGYSIDDRYRDTPKTYEELFAYTDYFLNENNFNGGTVSRCRLKRCPAIGSIQACSSNDRICVNSRLCPGRLIGCSAVPYSRFTESYYARACLPRNTTAKDRYTTVVLRTQVSSIFQCPVGKAYDIASQTRVNVQGLRDYCDYCECKCEENEYFISTAGTTATYVTRHVITGLRIVVRNRVIHLQGQQGRLLANGSIDEDTLSWLPLVENERLMTRIAWNQLRQIALTPVEGPKDRVLVSASFNLVSTNRIGLNLLYVGPYDFRAGSLSFFNTLLSSGLGTSEYNANDVDVPIRGRAVNNPDSSDNQWVNIKTTGRVPDGGQSTVPFIDTQDVAPYPPTALSGAQLYIRGQSGYGGFLGIKVFTYDFRDYIDANLDINPDDINDLL